MTIAFDHELAWKPGVVGARTRPLGWFTHWTIAIDKMQEAAKAVGMPGDRFVVIELPKGAMVAATYVGRGGQVDREPVG